MKRTTDPSDTAQLEEFKKSVVAVSQVFHTKSQESSLVFQ